MIRKRIRSFILIIIGLDSFLAADNLFALPADTIVINENTRWTDFGHKLIYGVDSSNSLTIEYIRNHPEFFSVRNTGQLLHGSNVWATILVRNESDQPVDVIVDVKGYKEIQVFILTTDDNAVHMKRTGRYIPFPENELGNFKRRTNKVELTLEALKTHQVFIFYPDSGPDKINLGFATAQRDWWLFSVNESDVYMNLMLGLFFGVTIILALINLVYYFFLRDKTYLNYSIYLGTFIYFEASRYGFLDVELFSMSPVISLIAESVCLFLAVIYYLVFLGNFVNLKSRFSKWHKMNNRVIGVLILGIGVLIFLMGVLKYPITAINVRDYFILITLPFIATVLFVLWLKGDMIDRIFVVGSFALLLSGLASIILDLFYLGTKYPDIIFQVGIILEITIFSIGLGLKSRQSELGRQKIQLQLIEQLTANELMQRSIQENLEQEVMERTKEITSQNEELIQQSEELAAQRDLMESQNQIIEKKNKELSQIREKLEAKVIERTKQLLMANNELIKHNSQLEQYAYVTAHNLRSPVARLKGLLYIFDKTVRVDKESRQLVDKISFAAHEMDDVLSDMNTILELKNKAGFMADKVSFSQVLEKSIRNLLPEIEESGMQINSRLEIDEITGSKPYFESIFYNMMSNAVKYRSETNTPTLLISSKEENGQIILYFTDNGAGIDLDRFGNKLFGMYQRFHETTGGKGLGLYLVKTQVEAMGGTIRVESAPGNGTTFFIKFPI